RFIFLNELMRMAFYGPPDFEPPSEYTSKFRRFRARLFTLSIDFDPALRGANRWMDRTVAATRIEERAERRVAMRAIQQELAELPQGFEQVGFAQKILMGAQGRGERIGNKLIAGLIPAMLKTCDAFDRIEQAHRLLHVALALKAYRIDNGRYPMS